MRLRRLLQAVLLALLLLGAVLAWNLWRLPLPVARSSAAPPLVLDEQALAQRLAQAIRIATVSEGDAPGHLQSARFAELQALLRRLYPRVHAQLKLETIGGSLLYTWPGRDAQARPALLAAHLDVVPADEDSLSRWTHAPFSGEIADGYIWGRGTLDDKSSALAWLEAAELLLAQDFVPAQTLYFAFGHDEEIDGSQGAQRIAALLRARGLRLEYVLDEGGVIGEGLIPGVQRPVATIMTAEKGYATFRLSTRGEGGHSSMPPAQTAVTQLIAALARLQQAPLPARLTPPVEGLLLGIAAEQPLPARLAIANRWLLGPLLLRQLQQSPVSNALVRSTLSTTVLQAGTQDNVIPAQAQALVNARLLPGERIADVQAHIRRAIADEGVRIELLPGASEASAHASAGDSPAYARIAAAVRQVFPDALVATGLLVGATDARHYEALADNRYNFMPARFGPEDLERMHGIDERIAIKAYADMVRYDLALLRAPLWP
ncbi:carboxypeptidase PM20D1 [Solimonas aquatica]|uniref:Carboxypeptidase PM20D1 n=1 Tax=Solimonas aquatica TaxID=489703 RepID=A0A1H9BPL9_9GAMM|nr:M20/M25/M40 family metallo-hydrolase [Solimonas aquatica]SEP90483.1 carboxypeptidase PM20D1 [Solimonas aquatica]